MTTWDESYFKDDLFQELGRFCPKSKDYAEKLWRVFNPHYGTYQGTSVRNIPDSIDHHFLKKLIPKYGERKSEHVMDAVFKKTAGDVKVYHGLEATYRLTSYAFRDRFIRETQSMKEFKEKVGREMILLDHLACMGTPSKIKKLIAEIDPSRDLQERLDCLSEAADAMQHLSFFWREADYRALVDKLRKNKQEYPKIKLPELVVAKGWELYSFPTFVMLCKLNIHGDLIETYILMHKESRRLETLLRSLCRSIRYFSYACRVSQQTMSESSFLQYLEYFIGTLVKTDRHNDVCRAWDVVYHTYLAKLASDIWNKSYEVQKEKYFDNEYNRIVDIDHVLKLLGGLNEHSKLDFMKLYKVLPPPDWDPSTGFLTNRKYHDSLWSYGVYKEGHELETPDLRLSDGEFLTFQELQLFRRHYRVYKRLPGRLTQEGMDYCASPAGKNSALNGFPLVNPNNLRTEELKYIDYENYQEWKYRDTSMPSNYSDKSCPPNNKDLSQIADGAELYSLPIKDRNYLLHYMTMPVAEQTSSIVQRIKSSTCKNQFLAHFKPESKKPDPRNFYSAKPDLRVINSEWEDNIEANITSDIAAFISKDPSERANALNSLLGTDFDKSQYRIVYVSFDLDKWSPRYSREGKIASTRVWSKFFDSPSAKYIPNLAHNAELHFMHNAFHQSYTADTIDAEGLWGKTNTVFHEDVMAFTVRKLRELKLIDYPGRLAVFIDDGLLTLCFKKDTTNEHITKVMKYIENSYYFFGFHISWDKTYVSENYATFLSEIYYKRAHVDMPFRAFLKMQRVKVSNELSPLAQTRSLIAMAKSSVSLGIPTHIVLFELTVELLNIFNKALRKTVTTLGSNPVEVAFWLMTPVALHGLGVPLSATWLQSPNGDIVENFYGTSEYLFATVPVIEPQIRKILEQTSEPRTALSILRSPVSFKFSNRCLSDMRHYKLVAPIMVGMVENPDLKWVLGQDLGALAKELLDQVDEDCEIEEIKSIYESSPISQFDKFFSKLKRGSTVMGLLSLRGRRSLQRIYLNEATIVLTHFLELVRV